MGGQRPAAGWPVEARADEPSGSEGDRIGFVNQLLHEFSVLLDRRVVASDEWRWYVAGPHSRELRFVQFRARRRWRVGAMDLFRPGEPAVIVDFKTQDVTSAESGGACWWCAGCHAVSLHEAGSRGDDLRADLRREAGRYARRRPRLGKRIWVPSRAKLWHSRSSTVRSP